MLDELSRTDLVFTWHSNYYELTPSGILLDCIGLGIPLAGRKGLAIEEIESEYGACGLFAEDVPSLLAKLNEFSSSGGKHGMLNEWRRSLTQAREARSASVLAATARRELQ